MMIEKRLKRGSGRWQIVAIGVVFALPIVAAYFWQPTGYVNYGELVEPARPLKDVDLQQPDGTNVPFSFLKQKWTLLYVGGPQCDDRCRNNLYKIQQVRLTQSKNIHRVQSVYVAPAELDTAKLADVSADYPGVRTLVAPAVVMQNLAAQLTMASRMTPDGGDRIYVIDPLGNFMMSYPHDADPSRMRKDLSRLLKVSQIG